MDMEKENGKRDDGKRAVLSENVGQSDLYYNVEDTPPIGMTLFFGIQIILTNICFCIMVAIIAQVICADKNFAVSLFSSITFMAGLITTMQSYRGVSYYWEPPVPIGN